MTRIHVLHENAARLPLLAQAFDQRRLPWTEWFLDAGTFDLAAPPPQGVFYNRMSASSHTRDHRFSAELTAAVLAWLTRWSRRVVNGPGALDLEISGGLGNTLPWKATASFTRHAPSLRLDATASPPRRSDTSQASPSS